MDQPSLIRALAEARFLILPSEWYEGHPVIAVQALASGIPVVSTPAVRLGLEPMQEGVMRVAENAEGIAGEVVHMIRNPAEAASLGERGRDWARAHFSWRTALEALESNGRQPEPTHQPLPSVAAGV